MTGKAPDVAGGDGTLSPAVRVEAVGRALSEVPSGKATDVVSLARTAAEAGEEHACVEELRVTLCLHCCPRHAGRAVIAAQQRWDRLDRGQQHDQGWTVPQGWPAPVVLPLNDLRCGGGLLD